MPPKKIVGGSKGGCPIGAKATKDGVEAEELHPELQSNRMELKPMVYDDKKLDEVNEIHKLMKECASFFFTVLFLNNLSICSMSWLSML
jgi:hypothetical protein